MQFFLSYYLEKKAVAIGAEHYINCKNNGTHIFKIKVLAQGLSD
jgi:hypothetical protein